ncbi:hypothetical protein MANES_11G070850v8 [Manihot esculenta]|uniref:Uncharacterized protein n=1 Tax=Manihot esculenta TaxID=3983 RepID=A0ACB7GVQ4_MANES|nr:hypothetical protein MANES_11G070850v8 [Manihot esculenta]
MQTDVGWQYQGVNSLMDWFLAMFVLASVDKYKLILMVCWALWTNRSIVWEYKEQSPSQVFYMTSRFLQNWTAVVASSLAIAASSDHLRSWQRPPEGWMKVNVDASTGLSLSFVGLDAIVRNSYGEFVAAKVWRYPGFFSPKNTEL